MALSYWLVFVALVWLGVVYREFGTADGKNLEYLKLTPVYPGKTFWRLIYTPRAGYGKPIGGRRV
jgi:hypothetical protein